MARIEPASSSSSPRSALASAALLILTIFQILPMFLFQAQILVAQSLNPVPETRNVVAGKALQVIKDLEQRNLPYSNHGPDLRDCSGIFHQILNRLESSCPNFLRPPVGTHRTSKGIAQWYSDQKHFQTVNKALKQDDLIEPGMILFFGQQNHTYKRMSESTTLSKVSHLGIVVSVSRDSNGHVQYYKLFHGRSSGRAASVTFHGRKPSNKKHPALGNGNQQWIGTASLCQGASCACSPQKEPTDR